MGEIEIETKGLRVFHLKEIRPGEIFQNFGYADELECRRVPTGHSRDLTYVKIPLTEGAVYRFGGEREMSYWTTVRDGQLVRVGWLEALDIVDPGGSRARAWHLAKLRPEPRLDRQWVRDVGTHPDWSRYEGAWGTVTRRTPTACWVRQATEEEIDAFVACHPEAHDSQHVTSRNGAAPC